MGNCRQITLKFGHVRSLANLFTEFREIWSPGSVIPCSDTHQSFTDVPVKWFFDNFIFADSFRLVSIHGVARGLGASFLYKRPTSRGSSL